MKLPRSAGCVALLFGLCSSGSACRGQVATPAPAENAPPSPAGLSPAAAPSAEAEQLLPFHVRAEGQLGPGTGMLLIDLTAPPGAKLTLDAPVSARGSGGIGIAFPRRLSGPLGQQGMPLRLPIEVADGATGPAKVELSYYWCSDGNEAACRRELALLSIDLDLSGSGAGGEAHLSHSIRSTD